MQQVEQLQQLLAAYQLPLWLLQQLLAAYQLPLWLLLQLLAVLVLCRLPLLRPLLAAAAVGRMPGVSCASCLESWGKTRLLVPRWLLLPAAGGCWEPHLLDSTSTGVQEHRRACACLSTRLGLFADVMRVLCEALQAWP